MILLFGIVFILFLVVGAFGIKSNESWKTFCNSCFVGKPFLGIWSHCLGVRWKVGCFEKILSKNGDRKTDTVHQTLNIETEGKENNHKKFFAKFSPFIHHPITSHH